jgi:hypothetical protein
VGSKPVGISASRGAAILGLSEYSTQFEVWQRICEERRPGFNASRGYVLPEDPDNAAIRWGSAFENAVTKLAQARMGGCKIEDREVFWSVNGLGDEPFFQRQSGEHMPNYITCHIDGRYSDSSEDFPAGTLHEGKTTGLFNYHDNWGEPGTNRIPQIYQVQVQHQMLCTGAAEAIVSVLVFPRRPEEWEEEGIKPDHYGWGDNPPWCLWRGTDSDFHPQMVATCQSWARVLAEMGLFHQYPVAASPTLQRQLVATYRDFWHTYVLAEKEPELATYEDVRRAFPAPIGTIVADEQAEGWAREYSMIGEEISRTGRLGKRREELKVLLLKSMRAADSTMDDESREKTVLRDGKGGKLAQWDGTTFRGGKG